MRCVNCDYYIRDKSLKPQYIGYCSFHVRENGRQPLVSDSLCGCDMSTGELWNFLDTDNYTMKTAPEGVLD